MARQAGLRPHAALIIASARALKLHGGVPKTALATENGGAVRAGLPNLLRHVDIVHQGGQAALVAINIFPTDTEAEVAAAARARAVNHQRVRSAGVSPRAYTAAPLPVGSLGNTFAGVRQPET